MKILICGAGIAGNSLAFWLARLGHKITVIERSAALRTAGLRIDLRGQAIEVIKRMGVEQPIRHRSAPEQGLRVVDGSGRQRGYFPASKGSNVQNFTSEYEIMRGDLCRILYESVDKDRVNYLFGNTVEHFEQTEEQVHVHFTSGEVDSFDLLVGADGQWSRTRKLMLGDDTEDKLFLIPGVYVAYYTVPLPMELDEDFAATLYVAEGKGIMTRRQNKNTLQVYIGGKDSAGRLSHVTRGDTVEEKKAVKEMLKGLAWKGDTLLKHLDEASDFYCERIGLVKLDAWSNDRVVLVGDAGYCPSVNTGMGTTSGIVGSYVLAGEIARFCKVESSGNEIRSALIAYERTFRPFMTAVQKGVLEDAGSLPDGKFGTAIFNILIGVASFCKVNIAKWMMKENSVRFWGLPSYDELK